ncbi:unnamed protein product [Larinioides sclopetarius]|uniref:Chitin-binding type-2 domain-containing protein n=1 Tax=Larinioides sclopetarius TaxID=280406 RepID=A0AAV2B5K1_9ARAC
MLRVVFCCAILALFPVRGAANPAIVRQCRAGTCDDRPVCPQSPCRCLYPSRVDCALYYLCEQGKPRQYRCSQGLLFNEDTLTCDYDFNVNCSIGKTTRTSESSTGLMTTSESSYSSVGTANTTPASTQRESHSKSTVKDDTTILDTSIESKKTSDLPTYSNTDTALDTTYSKSSDFVTEIITLTPTSKQNEELETTKSTFTTKKEELTETENPVSGTEESVVPDTSKSIFTDKESKDPETTNPSTTKGNEVSKTTNPSTTKENEVSETINPSTTQEDEVSEANNPSTTQENEVSETTNPSTTKGEEVSETTNPSTTQEDEASEANNPSTTQENEVSETTNTSTTKETEVSETTNPSTTQENEVSETTNTSTTQENKVSETNNPSTTKENEVSEKTSPSTTKEEEVSETNSPSTTQDNEVSETNNPSTTKVEEVSETTNPSTTQENEVSETTNTSTTQENEVSESNNPSTTKENEVSETTNPSTTQKNEVSETTNPSTTQENEVSETTNPSTTKGKEVSETTSPSTTKEIEESEATRSLTTIATNNPSTTKENEVSETTNPSTTQENEVSETTNTSTTQKNEVSETNNPSTTQENEVSETTNPSTTKGKEVSETTSPSTTKEIEESEATRSITTIATTSKTASVNGSTVVTENSLSTGEIQSEVTTSIQNWTCPTRFGLFPDQSDCHKFYHCSHWKPYHKECPSKLHFNPALKVCDWPENAGCVSTAFTEDIAQTLSTPSQQTTTASGNNASFCGCNSCELPIPNDCNSYILCIDQSATLISCGSGLNFNVKTGTCDWEENVVCETNTQCPRPMGRFPYPQSCYHFMDCNNAVMTINKCPEEMVYSKSEEKCSWTAVCDDTHTSTETTSSEDFSNNQTTVSDENDISTTLSQLTSTDSTEISKFNKISTSEIIITEKFTAISTTASVPSESIPVSTNQDLISTHSPEFSTSSESFSNETDLPYSSTKVPTLSPPTDLIVSTEINANVSTSTATSSSGFASSIADDPTTYLIISTETNVKTSTSIATSPSGLASSVTEHPATDLIISTEINENSSTSTATSSSGFGSSIADDPVTDLIISTVIDANASISTVTSSSGLASSHETTANDVDSTVASTKRLVTVIGSSTETSKSPSTENHSAITEVTESSTNTAAKITEDYRKNTSPDASNMTLSSTETSGNSSFVCPSRFGLFPDPDSCFRFYHCSHWVALRKWCPSGLHFNPKLQVCDWPYRAGCGGFPVVPTFETIQPREEDITFNETCDCECCFYPNKTDCSKYTLCLNGAPHRGQCAEGLLFNPLDDNCDVADRVTCPQTPSSCPTPNAVYPHPSLCTAFYRCVNGQPSLQNCPEDKHFKASEGTCTDPCDADCDRSLDCNRPPPPPTCSESDALLPAEGDCSSYYLCAEGHAYFVRCPDGTHFNAEYGVCEPPCDARCDLTIECPSPVQHANSKSLNIPSTGCTKPNGLFPANDDCSAFYLCTKGRPHLLHCPPGLHYSSKDETCETPCNAQCDKNIECTHQKRGKEGLTPSAHLPLWLLCKILNNGSLPNPKNCTSFYSCSEGEARLVRCPRGLHFDPEAKECKSPCLAGCDSSVQCPFEIPIPKGRCSCENCYLQDPADCSAFLFCHQGFLTKGYCPRGTLFDRSSSQCRNASKVECEAIGDPAMCYTPSGNFPHPGNCSKFVRCEDSVAHIMDCEAGLEFDPTIQACANPKGRCGFKGKDPLCEEATGQFPHPQNSSLFYQCESGTKFLKSCSTPLIYNALDQVCDWPHNIQDKSIEETFQSRGTEDEITRYSTILSAYKKSVHSNNSACRSVAGVTCPCACRVTTYDDCDSFYHCRRDGKACKRRCPDGLYFNRRTMVCDLPQNVECRDFFFATLRRLRSANVIKASLKFPFQAIRS